MRASIRQSWGVIVLALVYSQAIQAQNSLTLTGLDGSSRSLSVTELARLPHQTLTAKDKEGQAHRYEGVALSELFALLNAPQGKAIHGEALRQVMLVTGQDGYQVVFALPELDPTFAPQSVLLADRRDGQPLPVGSGPYQVIVPQEKRPARWVRQVISLRLLAVQP